MTTTPPPTARPKPTVARFLLDAPVLPLVTDTVRVAEALRNTLMSHFRRWCRRHPAWAEPFRRSEQPGQFASPTLSRKDKSGATRQNRPHAKGNQLLQRPRKDKSGPTRQDHRHACYPPTADGADGRWLTHVTVTAGEGIGPSEVAAFNGVRTLKLVAESADLPVQLVGLGDRQDFRVHLLEEATAWISATPFVATRYPKLRGTKCDGCMNSFW